MTSATKTAAKVKVVLLGNRHCDHVSLQFDNFHFFRLITSVPKLVNDGRRSGWEVKMYLTSQIMTTRIAPSRSSEIRAQANKE